MAIRSEYTARGGAAVADAFRKVRSREPLRIPAAAYNAFIDAARANRERSTAPSRDPIAGSRSLRWDVLVENGSGEDVPLFGVLGVQRKLVLLNQPEERFLRSRDVLGRVPTSADFGKFVIAAEPIPAGRIGRASSIGVTIARVKDIEGGPRFCDIDEGEVNHLVYNPAGNAQILWQAAQEIEAGLRWCLLRLGPRPPVAPGVMQFFTLASPNVINQGSDSSEAVIVYGFVDDLEFNTLATDLDPGAPPHHWRRPNLGRVDPGDMAMGYFNPEGEVRIAWCNERPLMGACDT
ncbi:MAG: hypothetical protein EA376_00020 [Phycisphaeraceae bacterium]|nr:MAG: hypothetical protein EA376_00020 [Phycisphaeraceae bacterium]